MATIYRFVVENKVREVSSGRKSGSSGSGRKKSVAKVGRDVSIFAGSRGGVEHGRRMRAINPLINKITFGYWEKSVRVGRAGGNLIANAATKGAVGGAVGVAVAIIISFAIQTILKFQNHDRKIANERNNQNYKMLENSSGAVRGEYEIMTNWWSGRQTYNQNK